MKRKKRHVTEGKEQNEESDEEKKKKVNGASL